jgi:ERCC4-related helicase
MAKYVDKHIEKSAHNFAKILDFLFIWGMLLIAIACDSVLFSVGLMHGDMSQMERNEVITAFKKKEFPILVATDVAGLYKN